MINQFVINQILRSCLFQRYDFANAHRFPEDSAKIKRFKLLFQAVGV